MRYKSRKFQLALIITLLSFVALMLDKLNGGDWVTLVGIVTGFYSGANVLPKLFPKRKQLDPTISKMEIDQ